MITMTGFRRVIFKKSKFTKRLLESQSGWEKKKKKAFINSSLNN